MTRSTTDNHFRDAGGEAALEAAIHEDFERIFATVGLDLVCVERQPALYSGRLDLLALDIHARLHIIEIKSGAANPAALTQLLSYGHRLGPMGIADLWALTERQGRSEELREEFRARFGRELVSLAEQPPALLLIAQDYEATVKQAIEYIEQRASLQAFTFRRHGSNVVLDRSLIGRAPVKFQSRGKRESSTISTTPVRRYVTINIDPDAKKFWTWFDSDYPKAFASIPDISNAYERWLATSSTEALPLNSIDFALLCKQVKFMTEQNSGWHRVFFDPSSEDAARANLRSLRARSRIGSPFTRTGYVRGKALTDGLITLVDRVS